MDRILRNTAAALSVTFDVDGTANDADADAVTVDVVREDGTVLIEAAAAANGADGDGTYSYTLAPQAQLDVLRLDWTASFAGVAQTVSTWVEVVGGFCVALADIRAQKNLDSAAKFTTAELADARAWFEDLAEEHCGVAFAPRYHRDVLDGDGCSTALLSKLYPRQLIGVTVDDVVETTTGWALYDHGEVRRPTGTFTCGDRNVSIAYEHGHQRAPAQLRTAALIAIRDRLLDDETGRRQLSVTNEFGGTTRYAVAGDDRPTGIPEVDAVLNRLNETVPGIG